MEFNVNNHSSVQIDNIFVDPFLITDTQKKAKYVLITHTHYDHLSIDDIQKIIQDDTVLICTNDAVATLQTAFPNHTVLSVKPNQSMRFFDFELETFPAYNTNKEFHKKEYNWVGYKIYKKNKTYAVLGDTDCTPELKSLECDVLFVPIGGTYTMNGFEAAKFVNKIKPSLVVPTHYNSIVGSKEDEFEFLENLNNKIKYQILL